MKTNSSAIKLLKEALLHVESQSIRTWACSKHNHPVWLQIAESAVKNGKTDVHMFAAYIVAQAIGL